MGFFDLFFHLVNFVAPAIFIALVLALGGAIFMKKTAAAHGLLAQAAINCVVGCVVLGLGLWIFGNDGKMATYAALVLAVATSQWAGGRGWR